MKSKMELDAEEACKAFPCLVFKKHDRIGSLEGKLISAEDMKSLYLTKKDVIGKDDILEVLVGIPADYQNRGCNVIDCKRVIDWSRIPYEHMHRNSIEGFDIYTLCTHLPEEVPQMDNPILENLKSAYALYNEYKRFLRCGKYELREYSHGENGRREYERDKKIRK